MSMFQFFAAVEGVRAANDPQTAGKLSDAERDELWDWVQSTPVN